MDTVQAVNETPAIQTPHPAVNVREAVGVFSDMEALNQALVEIDHRFPRHAVSVLGSRTEIEEQFGEKTVSPDRADSDATTPHEAPLRPEEKALARAALIGGGAYVGAVALAIAAGAVALPVTIMAAAIGGGGGAAFGAILGKVLGDHYHQDIEEQIAKGGLLLWINTPAMEDEQDACDILHRHGATHVKVIARNTGDRPGVEL
ncbi:MAG: hypothetical protein JWO78_1239 [Micavibrio sp.]|nr:hypothetical protein [Micavibrio sp.]